MNEDSGARAREAVDAVYRSDSRRVLATLIRLLGDFELAEEALHDALTAAVEQWPRDGVPANPAAWLVSTGRFRAISGIRRRARFNAALGELADRLETTVLPPTEADAVEDDRLRLIFTCCHPALPPAPVAGAARDVSNTPATGDRAPGSVHTEVRPTHRGGRPGIFSPPVFMGAGALLASLFFVVYLNSRSAPDDPSPDPTSPIVQPHPNPPPEGDPVKPPPSNPPSGRGRQEKGGASPQPPRLEEPTEPTRDGNSDRPTASAFAPGTWSGTLTFAGTASRIGVEFCQDASMRLSSRLGDRAFGKWLASANNMVSIDARHRDLGPFTCELALSGSSLEGPCEASGRSAGTIALSPDPGPPGTPSAAGIPLNGTVCEQRSFLEAPKPPAESPDQMRNRWEAFLRSIRN